MNENQAACLHCGVAAGAGKSFCPNCGNAVLEEAVICVKCGVSLKNNAAKAKAGSVEGIQTRSIVKAIVLSLVTCGIYGIYWFVKLTNELNAMTNNQNDTSGGMCLLLSIVTCGIYSFYWAYKMGTKKDSLEGNTSGSSAILYLVLSIFGLGIVAYALIQDAMNKAIDKATL